MASSPAAVSPKAATAQPRPQPLPPLLQAILDHGEGPTQATRGLLAAAAFQAAQQDRRPPLLGQPAQLLVQDGLQFPDGELGHGIGRHRGPGPGLVAAAAAGRDPSLFAGQSLRSGYITSAAHSGASLAKIADQAGHAKLDTTRGYVQVADAFRDHSGKGFL